MLICPTFLKLMALPKTIPPKIKFAWGNRKFFKIIAFCPEKELNYYVNKGMPKHLAIAFRNDYSNTTLTPFHIQNALVFISSGVHNVSAEQAWFLNKKLRERGLRFHPWLYVKSIFPWSEYHNVTSSTIS